MRARSVLTRGRYACASSGTLGARALGVGLVGETSVAFGAVALGLGMTDSVTGPEATAVAAAVAATEVLVTSVAGGCGEGDGVAGAACVGVPPDCAS